jgi:hypothetical protein
VLPSRLKGRRGPPIEGGDSHLTSRERAGWPRGPHLPLTDWLRSCPNTKLVDFVGSLSLKDKVSILVVGLELVGEWGLRRGDLHAAVESSLGSA